MPKFLIERNFAEQLELDRDTVGKITEVSADLKMQWMFSFLTADKKKTYCLFEAPNADAVREHARRLNLPADAVVEVSEVNAGMFA